MKTAEFSNPHTSFPSTRRHLKGVEYVPKAIEDLAKEQSGLKLVK